MNEIQKIYQQNRLGTLSAIVGGIIGILATFISLYVALRLSLFALDQKQLADEITLTTQQQTLSTITTNTATIKSETDINTQRINDMKTEIDQMYQYLLPSRTQ